MYKHTQEKHMQSGPLQHNTWRKQSETRIKPSGNNTHSAHVPSSESGAEWHDAGRSAVACTAHRGSSLVCCSCRRPYSPRAAIRYTRRHFTV